MSPLSKLIFRVYLRKNHFSLHITIFILFSLPHLNFQLWYPSPHQGLLLPMSAPTSTPPSNSSLSFPIFFIHSSSFPLHLFSSTHSRRNPIRPYRLFQFWFWGGTSFSPCSYLAIFWQSLPVVPFLHYTSLLLEVPEPPFSTGTYYFIFFTDFIISIIFLCGTIVSKFPVPSPLPKEGNRFSQKQLKHSPKIFNGYWPEGRGNWPYSSKETPTGLKYKES